jgi:hypothetical protein
MQLNPNTNPDPDRNPIIVPLISIICGFAALWAGYEALDSDMNGSLLQVSREMGSTWPLITVVLGCAFLISGITGILRRDR